VLAENDPLLPHIFETYKQQGILNGAPTNKQKGPAFENELAKAYPDCRLVVVKKVMTVENFIEVVYSLLKDKLNIAKLTFTSGANGASQEYLLTNQTKATPPKKRCPLCGIELVNGICPKCGYKEKL
jgi:6-pyruvoyltetrahydropterin/6-carboxytetrahydropterin synthase